MGTPARFPNGINNVAPTHAMANYGLPDPSKWHTFFTDFDTFVAGDWVITETGAAGTVALEAANGGSLLITTDALDNDAEWVQLTPASFLLDAAKRSVFKIRFTPLKATQSDIQAGLVVVDTTPLDATDGIYFQKDDGDALIDVYVRKDATTGSNSRAAVGTLVAATATEWAWYYGAGSASFFIDNVRVWTLDASSTYFPNAILTPSFGYQNGEAGAATMSIDYILAAQER